MKKIVSSTFRAPAQVALDQLPTTFSLDATLDEVERQLGKVRKKIAKQQDKMYAHDRYSVLLLLQGMDTAGKDSLIREVFKEVNARGVQVASFKTPTVREWQHDFLWRHVRELPERGKYGVWNRSHYENVLVTRVNPEYLGNELLPGIQPDNVHLPEGFWEQRIQSINDFERHITANGTIVIKVFLHLSKEEQRLRLLRRLEKEKHQWKFSTGDLKVREQWEKYQACYTDLLQKTNTDYAPWYIVPADVKENARYIVAEILYQTLEGFTDIAYPELDDEVKNNLQKYREQLQKEIS